MSLIQTWFMNLNLSIMNKGDDYGFNYATNNGNFMLAKPTVVEAENSFWSWAGDQYLAQTTGGAPDPT